MNVIIKNGRMLNVPSSYQKCKKVTKFSKKSKKNEKGEEESLPATTFKLLPTTLGF
jgi:hypothetical protein